MRTVVGVGIAGALGTLCRYGIGVFVADRYPGAFPLGTFLINVTGSFLLGLLFVLLTERAGLSPAWRTSVTVGFLGAYTTFSTFTLETFRLVEDGALGTAALNVIGSLAVGLIAVWLGVSLGRAL
jgi:fluoride exporter